MKTRIEKLREIADNPTLTRDQLEALLWAASLIRKMFQDKPTRREEED